MGTCTLRWGNESKLHSGWHLESVEVLHTASGLKTSFPHAQWVDAGADGTAEVAIAAGAAAQVSVCVCVRAHNKIYYDFCV